jgi:hypothetical protein
MQRRRSDAARKHKRGSSPEISIFYNRFVKSGAFSGVLGCEGARKSVTFRLGAGPFVVQFSGVPAETIGMVISPQ